MKYHLVLEPFELNNVQYFASEYIPNFLVIESPEIKNKVSEETYDLILGQLVQL